MNAIVTTTPFPPAADFVQALWARLQQGYPQAIGITCRALAEAGADRDELLRLAGNGASRGAFLIGCCAEELVATGSSFKGRTHRQYVAELVELLKPLARPIRSRRVGPDLRRLIVAGAESPTRLRVRSVDYMLEINDLSVARAILASHPACQLQVECSITVDGISGCLMELMSKGALNTPSSHHDPG
jgi:hypothetical protein